MYNYIYSTFFFCVSIYDSTYTNYIYIYICTQYVKCTPKINERTSWRAHVPISQPNALVSAILNFFWRFYHGTFCDDMYLLYVDTLFDEDNDCHRPN